MKILFLTFYYPPDQTPGAFRSNSLVKQLLMKNTKAEINILTSTPNRYKSYKPNQDSVYEDNLTNIERIYVRPHTGRFFDQAVSYIYFVFGVLKQVKNRDYDIVFATSSRLMTAVLGTYIARQKKAPAYIDIRDIFLDTIKDIFNPYLYKALSPIISYLEKYVIVNASKINLISEGFQSYFNDKYNLREFSFFSNGIDDVFIDNINRSEYSNSPSSVLKIVYAGNIGKGQALEKIIPDILNYSQTQIEFRVFGSGSSLELLRKKIDMKKMNSIKFFGPVDRLQLIDEYMNSDILFLHLDDLDCFEKVLPSKIFEYASTGKPILAGLKGYSAEFISNEIENAQIFHPCAYKEALNSLNQLNLSKTNREAFVAKYSRTRISECMAEDILLVTKVES